jgi:hypothetical protein
MEVFRRFFTPPSSSFFLFGPRGTGKSTFVRQYFPKALYIDVHTTIHETKMGVKLGDTFWGCAL